MATATPAPVPVEIHRAPLTIDEELAIGFVYCLRDASGTDRYVGSTRDCVARWAAHRQMGCDGNASALHRYVAAQGGTLDGWELVVLREVHYDSARVPLALLRAEEATRTELLAQDAPLLNRNRAFDPCTARREYQRAWRLRHPGYMSAKSREHRARRRAALAAATA